jgi:hypothetical protein
MKLKTCSRRYAGFTSIRGAILALLLVQAALIGGLVAWHTRTVVHTTGREAITSAMFILSGSIIAVFFAGHGFRRKPFVSPRRPVVRRRPKAKVRDESQT